MPDSGENLARARLEGTNASYKDLSEVCGRIRGKNADWALNFLELASKGEIPVLYKRHNKKLGQRRELGGAKGRYPKKAAGVVLKVLRSAIANGNVVGIGTDMKILSACANKKLEYPRIASKGRWARANLETSRVEIILKGNGVPKGVEVTPPAKKEAKEDKAAKKEVPKKDAKSEEKAEAKETKSDKTLKVEAKVEHKHEAEKKAASKDMPHQHGEDQKR